MTMDRTAKNIEFVRAMAFLLTAAAFTTGASSVTHPEYAVWPLVSALALLAVLFQLVNFILVALFEIGVRRG